MDDLVFMDAEIRPNRSLSRRGFVVLITVLTVLNCASAAVFLSMGAVFVPMFLGLDLVAVVVAFLVSFAAAKQIERVRVTDRQVQVFQETPTWKKLMWESPTAFTRVTLLTEDDHATLFCRPAKCSRARVARPHSPSKRAEFAKALEGAIYSARRARF